MRGTRKGLEHLDKKDAVSKPPLCKGPIPPIRGKCPEGTKGVGRWLGVSRDGGIVVVLPSPRGDNPSVSLMADSSLYTREPLILPAFGANAPGPKPFPSSVTGFARATFPQGKAGFARTPNSPKVFHTFHIVLNTPCIPWWIWNTGGVFICNHNPSLRGIFRLLTASA